MIEQTAFFLKYLPLKITLTSVETASLPPYLGSTLRGAIGQVLRHDTDAYNYLYNNRVMSDNHQDIVNPYVIIPPAMNKTSYCAGEELCFEMLLFGDAIKYAGSLIEAMNMLQSQGLGASRYPFMLSKVTHSINQRLIWQENSFNAVALQSALLPWRSLPGVRRVTVRTLTPLRIRRDGKLIEQLDFPVIIRNITCRIEAITTRYGGWTDKEEIKRIQTISSEIPTMQSNLYLRNMERYSNRQGQKMDFSGMMGIARFDGDLTPFVPWLYAAEILHIGRNTTFGMGQIDVEFL